jgi:hypothetical protein
MEQVMGESKVEEDYQKAGGGKNPSAPTATNHYKVDNPFTSAITGSGTTKQEDMKEMNLGRILMSHSV